MQSLSCKQRHPEIFSVFCCMHSDRNICVHMYFYLFTHSNVLKVVMWNNWCALFHQIKILATMLKGLPRRNQTQTASIKFLHVVEWIWSISVAGLWRCEITFIDPLLTPNPDTEQHSDATAWPWNVILWCLPSLHCLLQTLTLCALVQHGRWPRRDEMLITVKNRNCCDTSCMSGRL